MIINYIEILYGEIQVKIRMIGAREIGRWGNKWKLEHPQETGVKRK